MAREIFRKNAVPVLESIVIDADTTLYQQQHRYVASAKNTIRLLSPRRLVLRVVLSIFITEFFVMFLLKVLPLLPPTFEALFDSTILLILLSPTFYYLKNENLSLRLTLFMRSPASLEGAKTMPTEGLVFSGLACIYPDNLIKPVSLASRLIWNVFSDNYGGHSTPP